MIRVRIVVTTELMGDVDVEVLYNEIFSPPENKLNLTEALDDARAKVNRAYELGQ